MDNHTQKQLDEAFLKARFILEDLIEFGVTNPSIELHHDASGVLWLGHARDVTPDMRVHATNLIRSSRITTNPPFFFEAFKKYEKTGTYRVGIQFCHGLIEEPNNT